MEFKAKDFGHLLGTRGFSDELLRSHYKLYEGYVIATNKLVSRLKSMKKDDKATPEFAELKRRFGWEFNGMRLHELYFGNIDKIEKTLSKDSPLFRKLKEQFTSFDNWKADFRAVGMMRGIGWVVLYWDQSSGRLFNTWINEHDGGHLGTCQPLLVMDVFEHAYIADYNLNRSAYIDSFFAAVDWDVVVKRYSIGEPGA